jgi:hypothetical protein
LVEFIESHYVSTCSVTWKIAFGYVDVKTREEKKVSFSMVLALDAATASKLPPE